MPRVRHLPAQRARIGRGFAVGLTLLGVASCGVPVPATDHVPSRVVVAVTAVATERQPTITTALRDAVTGAATADRASLDVVVDSPDGPRTVVTVDLVPRRGGAVERSAERRDQLLDATVAEIDQVLGTTGGDSGRIDVLGLLGHVARIPGPVTAVVASSGLQSVGPLAVGTIGWDLVGSDAVLDDAAAQGLLPDLTDTTVVFSGIGDVAAPQERLPERLRSRLATMWLGVCERSGARACEIDTEPGDGSPTVSTVPAPTVPIPADPVLAVPARLDAPVVTELPGDVLFEPDSARLLAEAEVLLGSVAARLPAGAEVELTGRTATVGSAESSRDFSLLRARGCADALIRAGVPADRITVRGLGFDAPLAADLDADGRLIPEAARRNRSVTLTIHGGTP